MIITSLTVPAFAESYTDKFPNCSALDGFVTNAGDSSGLAKECLDRVVTSISSIEIQNDSQLTLSEITTYCSQFNSDKVLEEYCVDDYVTAEEYDYGMQLGETLLLIVLISIPCILFGVFCILLHGAIPHKIFVSGLVSLVFGFLILVLFPQILEWVHPPLV